MYVDIKIVSDTGRALFTYRRKDAYAPFDPRIFSRKTPCRLKGIIALGSDSLTIEPTEKRIGRGAR